MLKKLALAIILVCGAVSAQQIAGTTEPAGLVPGTIYNTDNIVQPVVTGSNISPWVNGVYQPYLQCMAGGQQGNCGPNPSVTPLYSTGYMVFSYGLTDLYQAQSIASVLPTTGLRINGYNFGFTAKNGSGWDDGRVDQLNAYVAFYGTDGKIVDYTNYDLNSKFNWTRFNYTKDFVTPYADKDLSTIRYGFVGKDNNFWAGNYGPEIMDVNFSLKYSVDPCATNVLSSPTCPGYLDALLKSIPTPTPTATVDPIANTTISAGTTTTTTVTADPIATVSVTSTTTIGQPSVVASVVSAPAPTTTTANSSTSSSTTSSTQSTKESTGSSSGGNTNLALSVISKNSERDAAGSAVAQSAVAQAQQAANQAQQEAQSVAASAVANSTTMNPASTTGQSSSGNGIRVNTVNSNSTNFTLQSGQSSIASVVSGPLTSNSMQYQQQSSSTGLSILNNQSVSITSASSQQSSTTSTFALPLIQPQQPTFNIPNTTAQTEQQTQSQTLLQNNNTSSQYTETYSIVPPNFLTDKSNPLTDIIEGKQNIPQNSTIATIGSSVNKNTSDNEIAGGVDINKMALAPIGYGSYLNLAMRDASFYAPKEVYKNQKNVDNARALRQLSSDRLHQDMVEQQYRR